MKAPTRTLVDTREAVEDHIINMRSVLSLMTILFGGEVHDEQRPEDEQISGLFSFLNTEAQAIRDEIEEAHEPYFTPDFWGAALSVGSLANTTELVIRTVGGMPFNDSGMSEVIAALQRAVALVQHGLDDMHSCTAVRVETAVPPACASVQRKRSKTASAAAMA